MMHSRTLLIVIVASTLSVLASANPCCHTAQGSPFLSNPGVGYTLSYAGVESYQGQAAVTYSTKCGACVAANFNLNSFKTCTIDGPPASPKGYQCTFYLTNIYEYSSSKQKKDVVPCQYSTDIGRRVNATHVETCSTQYLGVGSASFSLSGPKSKATVTCKDLFPQPTSCYTYNQD